MPRSCRFQFCSRASRSAGLCDTHYKQLKSGKPLKPIREHSKHGKSLAQRLEDSTSKGDGCWEWNSTRNDQGYGVMRINGQQVRAHRKAFEIARGPIPPGMFLDHICRNRGCVRPDHLRIATAKQNAENTPSHTRGRSGVRGVHWSRSGWRAAVGHHGKTYYAGCYKTIPEAAHAARELRNRLFTHNAEDRKAA